MAAQQNKRARSVAVQLAGNGVETSARRVGDNQLRMRGAITNVVLDGVIVDLDVQRAALRLGLRGACEQRVRFDSDDWDVPLRHRECKVSRTCIEVGCALRLAGGGNIGHCLDEGFVDHTIRLLEAAGDCPLLCAIDGPVDMASSINRLHRASDAQLTAIVAAAQSAASSSNLQPWSVIAVRDPHTRARLAELAGDQAHVQQAPLVLVWLADLARLESVGQAEGLGHAALDYLEMALVGVIDTALAAQNAMAAAESRRLVIDVVSYPDIEVALQNPAMQGPFYGLNYTDHYRIGGVKISLDGSPQGKTAWLSKPYYKVSEGEKPDYAGYPAFPTVKVDELITQCGRAQFSLITLVRAVLHCAVDIGGCS